MRIDDFEKMQQNLAKLKNNLQSIQQVEMTKSAKRKAKKRRAVQKEINRIKHPKVTQFAKEEHIIVMITIAIVAFTCIFSTSIFAKTMSENITENPSIQEKQNEEKEVSQNTIQNENQEKQISDTEFVLEKNENAIQLEEILLENVSVLKSKEYIEEERPLAFEMTYQENPNLPEGEEVISKEGVDGRQQVKVIKSYENNRLVAEDILESIVIESATPQVIDKGTSKFLSNNKAHLGDTMYTTKEIVLMDSANDSANQICTIFKSLDIILLELQGEEWCKIECDGLQGYVKCKDLTSSKVTPGIVEANRIQRIKMTLAKEMPLNHSTNLTLEDYKRILSGNLQDKNHIIEENAEVFYNMDKKYNMNGVFLASMAIHESGWATSTISKDKKNLFGYGAYDRSPYASSFSFETYAEGIELVAKVLVKNYINETGTPIYEGESAKGSYYNGPTVAGVNVRYASDENWNNKIYKYMEYLYNKL